MCTSNHDTHPLWLSEENRHQASNLLVVIVVFHTESLGCHGSIYQGTTLVSGDSKGHFDEVASKLMAQGLLGVRRGKMMGRTVASKATASAKAMRRESKWCLKN